MGVVPVETFGGCRIVEQQHGLAGGIGERARKHQFAAFGCLPRQFQMDCAIVAAPTEIIGREIEEEQECAIAYSGGSTSATRAARTAS